MIDYVSLKQTIDKLDNDKVILVAGHKNADYDSICSSLALTYLLNKLGKKSYTLLDKSDMEKTYWLNTEYITTEYSLDASFNFILLDANRKNRLGIFENLFDKAKITINIDHHEDNKNEASFVFVDENISSTAEIICNLIREYTDDLLDKEIATLIYSGIVSDTNSFYKRTTPNTMRIASHLLEYGIDATYIIKHTCKNISLEESNILADMIKNIQYNNLHYIVLDRNNEMYKDVPYNTIFKKCASYIYEISDIRILGIFLIELDGSVSGLLRSNCDIDIDVIAKKFGGGGHKKASGFETNMKINDILKDLNEYIAKNSTTF